MSGDLDLGALVRSVAELARPGEQIEAYASRSQETDIDVFDGNIESLSVAGSSGIGIRVIVDHRQGYAWAGSLDADIVADTLAEARDNAQFAEPDDANGLVDPATATAVTPPVLDLWRDALATVGLDAKIECALDLDSRVRAADSRVRGVEQSSYGDGLVESALANSLGVAATSRRTVVSASSVAIAGTTDDTQTGYGFSVGRSFDDLDLDAVVAMAVERSTRLLGARQIAGRRIPVIFDPMVTASFLGVLASAFNAEAMLKGRSMFGDRVGDAIAAPTIGISDDPTDPLVLGATAHDSEGVSTRPTCLVERGVLQGFLHNAYTARRSGGRTTGSAVRGGVRTAPGVGARSLRIDADGVDAAAVLALFPEALYVQAVHGLHSGTNPISGDFSVGAEGLLVRAGAYAEPVREVTIASTVPRMLLDIAAVGDDVLRLPGSTVGRTLVLSEMTLSGA
mgnify:FL=1